MKTAAQEIFGGREKKKFFKDDNERNLWIKLNAEHIRYGEKVVNNKIIEDLGSIDKAYSPLWISNNQLTYDEYMHDAPRISFEEFLTLSDDQLVRLTREKNRQKIEELFDDFKKKL
jgi:hypothetical protein